MNCTDFVPGNQEQTCKVCGRVDHFDFYVDDATWRRVVPAEFVNRVVCLPCFDGFAAERGVSYANALSSLYFVGKQAIFAFTACDAQDTPKTVPA